MLAYQINQQELQWTALPDWALWDRFDVDARYEAEPGIAKSRDWDRNLERLQALLRTRLRLEVHREMKVVPAYTLSVDKGGVKCKPSAPGEAGAMSRGVDGHIIWSAHDMDEFADYLALMLQVRVVNETGLAGDYTFRVDFQPEEGLGAAADYLGGLPTLTNAIRSQLGLKLVSKPRLLPVFVVDHVERPSAN